MSHPILQQEIEYFDSTGQRLIGYLAYPDHDQPVPAVLVCPEWWGRNAYLEQRARELAEHGYAALAIDMYGDKKLAHDPATANSYMMDTFANPSTIVDRATAAYHALADLTQVDASKIAVIGFCYGGKVALDLARSGAELKAVATFHANLSAQHPAEAGVFKAEVLVAHGADDSMVSLDDVEGFKQEMANAKVPAQIDIYPQTKHGFSNPAADENASKYGIDLGYNAAAEQAALTQMYQLFERKLG